jgi:hypothetical protein
MLHFYNTLLSMKTGYQNRAFALVPVLVPVAFVKPISVPAVHRRCGQASFVLSHHRSMQNRNRSVRPASRQLNTPALMQNR